MKQILISFLLLVTCATFAQRGESASSGGTGGKGGNSGDDIINVLSSDYQFDEIHCVVKTKDAKQTQEYYCYELENFQQTFDQYLYYKQCCFKR